MGYWYDIRINQSLQHKWSIHFPREMPSRPATGQRHVKRKGKRLFWLRFDRLIAVEWVGIVSVHLSVMCRFHVQLSTALFFPGSHTISQPRHNGHHLFVRKCWKRALCWWKQKQNWVKWWLISMAISCVPARAVVLKKRRWNKLVWEKLQKKIMFFEKPTNQTKWTNAKNHAKSNRRQKRSGKKQRRRTSLDGIPIETHAPPNSDTKVNSIQQRREHNKFLYFMPEWVKIIKWTWTETGNGNRQSDRTENKSWIRILEFANVLVFVLLWLASFDDVVVFVACH